MDQNDNESSARFINSEPQTPAYIPFDFLETKPVNGKVALAAAVFFLAFIIGFGILLDRFDKNGYYAAGIAFSIVGLLLALLRGVVLDHFGMGSRDTTFWRCIIFIGETWCGVTAAAFIVPTGPVASVCLYFLLLAAFAMYSIQRYYGAERVKESVITFFSRA